MIESIEIDFDKLKEFKPSSPNLYDFKNIDMMLDNQKIIFKKGLNVIVGGNGYGKSAMLNILTTMMFNNKSFEGELNKSEILNFKRNPVYRFSNMVHDGQQTYFINTSQAVGLEGGSFTDSNFEDALVNILVNQRQSNGQGTMTDLNKMFKKITSDKDFLSDDKFSDKIIELLKTENFSDSDVERITRNHKFKISEKSQKTIFIDEFEKGLSLKNELDVLKALESLADNYNYQIIMSSQSPFLSTLFFKMNGSERKVNFIGEKNFMINQVGLMLGVACDINNQFNEAHKNKNKK